MTLDILLLVKIALSLIKASFPNNKAVQLQRRAIYFLFFLPEISREFSSRAYSRGEEPSQGHVLCAAEEFTEQEQSFSGALLTGSKAIGAWETLSLLQALMHHRDHNCSLLNRGKNTHF